MGFFDRFRSATKTTASSHPVGTETSGENSMRLIDEGNALESAGKIDEAMQCYETATRLTPDLARAHLNRGNIFLLRGNFDSAVDAYRMAILKAPDYASAHFNLGNAFLHSNKFNEARSAYETAIGLKPDFVDAHVALGCVLEEQNDLAGAADMYRQALHLKPDYAEVHFNLGSTLKALNSFDEAEASFRSALRINPDFVEALTNLTRTLIENGKEDEALALIHHETIRSPESETAQDNIGVLLQEVGSLEEALTFHRRALTINPTYARAQHNLGCCLQKLNRIDEAIAAYRRAVELDPEFIDSYTNLGDALIDLERPDEAAVAFEQVVALNPASADAHYNLGTALSKAGQLNIAVLCYEKAIEIRPDFANALNNLGISLQHTGQLEAALDVFRRTLEIDPTVSQAYSNMGLTFQDLGRFEEAADCFRKALDLNPDLEAAVLNLAVAYSNLGQLEEALTWVYRALELAPEKVEAYSTLLFLQNYLHDTPAPKLLEEARRYGELAAKRAPPALGPWLNTPEPDRKLRIGIVSGDLRKHPVGFFAEGVLSALATRTDGRLELIAYSNSFLYDAISQRIRDCCSEWESIVGISDEIISAKIREDKIDILIDLSGHTLHGRLPLFAWKPAPIQVTWLGYFATTGVGAIDYLIADPWTLPETEEINFTESIIRLPETRLCFTPPDETADILPLPALSQGHITLGCFNTLTKMNDAVVALWSRVLKAVPGSKLFLLSHMLRDTSVHQQTIDRYRAHGIGEERLILKGFVPRAEYFATYNQIDFALDPFPYCGGTTTVEALWMGVPVLTLAGKHFLSRQGVGLLMNAGLPEWVAHDPDEYVARAVSHASDIQGLSTLRMRLREQVLASPVFDAARFADHFEHALRHIWKNWCAQAREKKY